MAPEPLTGRPWTCDIPAVSSLVDTPYVRVRRLDDRTVCYERNETAYPNPRAIELDFDAVLLGLANLPCRRMGLVVDLRNARGRNDPGFEGTMKVQRQRLNERFLAVAVLVQSPVGRLQVGRYAQQDTAPFRTFVDEREARAWLATRVDAAKGR